LRISGKVEPIFVDSITNMPQAALDNAREGDVLMCMGAGSIGAVPAKIVELVSSARMGAA
jgi:UDP-N-acetylmuramate--alanine ligase